MADRPCRCLIVTDFNPGNFAGYLANEEESPELEPLTGDYGQVIPLLTQPNLPAWQEQPEFAIVWTQPEKVIPSFQKLLDCHPISTAELFAEVDEYTAALLQAASRLKAVWVPNWVMDAERRGQGMTDLRPGGVAYALQQLNARLVENLASAANVFVLNAQRWVNRAGTQAFAPKLWYQAKVPFGNLVFQEAVLEIKAAIRGMQGRAKKLVIVDLDNTLWGGVVGDVGWENLRVGGHDPVGEAYADFQRALKALSRRGILLGIVSKNEESVALTALQQHPEMQLRREDFAGWRINWHDKAANVVDLVSKLNLGLQSVVFLDDNPVERARVREALPEVLVPEWPGNPQLYPNALFSLRCFDSPLITEEDALRTRAYAAERNRTEAKLQAGSLDGWLRGLNTVVEIAPLNAANLGRAAQLLNKTNQMNLSTRRLSEAELKRWTESKENHFWVFRVSDKYGDSGITGLASLEINGSAARIVDFVLSCRVMGRQIEELMTHWLVREAKRLAAGEVLAEYQSTPKNKPCLDFWQRSGFVQNQHVFSWQTVSDYPLPVCIQVNIVPA
jgi:FkbH-like protein